MRKDASNRVKFFVFSRMYVCVLRCVTRLKCVYKRAPAETCGLCMSTYVERRNMRERVSRADRYLIECNSGWVMYKLMSMV